MLGGKRSPLRVRGGDWFQRRSRAERRLDKPSTFRLAVAYLGLEVQAD
jgi:hypothetical protein